MNKYEVLVNQIPGETRIALVKNQDLIELRIERGSNVVREGDIYHGKIARVVPGIQAAFVDIGQTKNAFLHVSDLPSTLEKVNDITAVVREGQMIVVQVLKEPLGTKGARVGMRLALVSRYLIYNSTSPHHRVSQRIMDGDERKRLLQIVSHHTDEVEGSFIVRTKAENINAQVLQHEMTELLQKWQALQAELPKKKVGYCLYRQASPVIMAMRDIIDANVSRIRLDSQDLADELIANLLPSLPNISDVISVQDVTEPVFAQYQIEQQIEQCLQRQVALKSGGVIVIDQTEAMVTVDVNTGQNVGHAIAKHVIRITNLEAVDMIARQLRLRNLGGIIIIDFIDMDNKEDEAMILQRLKTALATDPVKTTIGTFSELSLLELTRKRTRPSILQSLGNPCPHCRQTGMVKSLQTVAHALCRELIQIHPNNKHRHVVVHASQALIHCLQSEMQESIEQLQELYGIELSYVVEATFARQQYDVICH